MSKIEINSPVPELTFSKIIFLNPSQAKAKTLERFELGSASDFEAPGVDVRAAGLCKAALWA